jgi:membrane-bound metal-dependent hydrolase YbcI (DUF457 family)
LDPITHALVSLLLARAFFPRRSWRFVAGALIGGTLADIDLITVFFGPSFYLTGRGTITHSLLGTITVIVVAAVAGVILRRDFVPAARVASAAIDDTTKNNYDTGSLILACGLVAVVHVALDAASTHGVAIFWPFRGTRFSLDWLPPVDAWILALSIGGVFVPELFRLVSSEIGAKEKSPRGRNGALIALVLLVVYIGSRVSLHSSAVAQLDAHTYQGESAHRAAAFPEAISLTNWRGVVETTSSVCIVDVPVAETTRFDSERASCVHKPEASPVLAAAQQTAAVRQFLQWARFPHATLSPNEDGTGVVIRDATDSALGDTRYALAAEVRVDRADAVVSQRLAWARKIRLR